MEPKRDIDPIEFDEPGVALSCPKLCLLPESHQGKIEEVKSRLRTLRAGFPAIAPHSLPTARSRGSHQVQRVRSESRRSLRLPAWRSTKYARFDL
ncbi:MAG TPA: hypothetical protein VG820_04155 [Fimbriimonadaceae bacterium]|nr:hypothetical protein [Fimbriimonadaceae bacterium]